MNITSLYAPVNLDSSSIVGEHCNGLLSFDGESAARRALTTTAGHPKTIDTEGNDAHNHDVA